MKIFSRALLPRPNNAQAYLKVSPGFVDLCVGQCLARKVPNLAIPLYCFSDLALHLVFGTAQVPAWSFSKDGW